MKNSRIVLILCALVLMACETRYVDVGGEPDTSIDTASDSVELCSDGLDNDMDGLVDCNDNDGDENCPPCADASTDAVADEIEDSAETDVPPVELCSDGLDNDFDGLVDCNDGDDCCDEAVCVTSEHCASEDASSDSEEEADAVSDSGADSDPAEDPVPDTDPDTASDPDSASDPDAVSDPDVVDAEADAADILHSGLATFKWCRPMTMARPDHILAECFVWGSLYESWDDSWELATGSPDFVAPADSDCIEFTLPDLDYTLLGISVECNITAYSDSAYGPWGRIYALGECTCGGSCVVKGTLTVRSGPDADDATALDLTSLVVQNPRCASLSDQAGNYVLSPIP
ncbi:MAG: hypothetical protein PHW53_00320 [Patescibacteria group bacterium]|nr:hypothetical protein [Patescibacteria group bacterium]